MTIGTDLIAAERARQIEMRGFVAERDDCYSSHELVAAAICYADMARSDREMRNMSRNIVDHAAAGDDSLPNWFGWPREWSASSFRMGDENTTQDRIRELVKAGALIAAEIDRMQRQIAAADPTQEPRS